MTNYKEIVTKAVLSKGKRLFTTTNSISVENPSTILGCWVINHEFNGVRDKDKIIIDGCYDVNIWYSYDNDTKTNVVKQTDHYHEIIHMREHESDTDEEVIVRSLKQPSCTKTDLANNVITYTIEKELGIELVGDVKVKVEANMEEDPWDDIVEDKDVEDIKNVNEDFIKDDTVI